MRELVVVSPFNGMSCGRLALEEVPNVKVLRYYTMEIKGSAIRVSDDNFPCDIPHKLGDITKVDTDELLQDIHRDFGPDTEILLLGGSPCQDFSVANADRLGLAGIKSGLFFEYMRLFRGLQPTYFLLENVRMKKDQQDRISYELGCEPTVINSKVVVPQLRHRLYWTNIVDSIPPLVHTDKTLNDVLIKGYSDREYARALLESDSRPLSTPVKMAHRYFNTGFTTLIFKDREHFLKIRQHFNRHFKGKSALEITAKAAGIDMGI